METVIPESPKTVLEKPDEAAFRKKVQEIEDKIKEVNNSLKGKIESFEDTRAKKNLSLKEGEAIPGGNPVELKKLFSRLGELQSRKKKQWDRVN